MSSVERRGWERGYVVGRRQGIVKYLTGLIEQKFGNMEPHDRMQLTVLTNEQLLALIDAAVEVETYWKWQRHLDWVSPP